MTAHQEPVPAGGAGVSAADPEVFQPLADDDPRSVAGYLLSARLGAGGMGKVYLSYTPGGRPVAIKVIRPEFAEDPEFRRRFQQEVRAAQRVQGLYTAPVIDSDTEGPRPWLATAYVQGPSLHSAVAAHGPMPVASVLLLVAGIAEALQVIHRAGIVHRDLKPSNVLLAVDGPRVIDFGIARAADTTALTGTGVSVGTPSFMSPEQAAGTSCTEATDVFALGQIAVFAATGAAAFGDGSSHAVLYRIVHEDPDLSRLPDELREVVTGCLGKDPAQRPSTARIIEMCGLASQDPALRRPGSWLPSSYAADLTQAAAPTPPPHPATQAAPSTPPAYPATQAASHTPPVHPPTQAVHPQPAPAQPRHPSAPGSYAYPPTAGYPSQQAAGAPGGYPNRPFPGAAGGHPSGPWQPQQPRKRNRAGLVAAVLAAAALIGGGAYLVGQQDADKGSAKDSGSGAPKSGGGGTSDAEAGTGGKSKAPAAPEGTVYKNLSIPVGYAVKFADQPPQPEDLDVNYEGDFGYSGDMINGDSLATNQSENTMALLDPAEPGSLAGCRANTRYTTSIAKDKVGKGDRICVKTGSGHYGLVTLNGFASKDSPSQYVSVDLTVWRNVTSS
ncbi:serine/threonine-protein kinase [Streptomyces sp. B1I3]|uniref:serine/threonine-protein kinase n=1 Tax=Streptomyces sp. B1I3 TaxID=3042264 RepID=UPI002782692A|nr:serine/threonine-protein kinase [Streptomyces sp. B1I3]MDQ0797955.1 serine/threonine protein kinase [Streptomyces sp. B1I3]